MFFFYPRYRLLYRPSNKGLIKAQCTTLCKGGGKKGGSWGLFLCRRLKSLSVADGRSGPIGGEGAGPKSQMCLGSGVREASALALREHCIAGRDLLLGSVAEA